MHSTSIIHVYIVIEILIVYESFELPLLLCCRFEEKLDRGDCRKSVATRGVYTLLSKSVSAPSNGQPAHLRY